jgi:putative membrane protein
MLLKRLLVATAAAGVLLVPAMPAAAAPSGQDAAFLKAAHQSNLAEIAGGKIAQQKGNSSQVKDLGARFVRDHTTLDASLTKTAKALGVTLPSTPNSKQQAVAKQYQAASGSSFDTLFISTQMSAHMAAMAAGQKELSAGSDAQAKKVARTAAPVIASHHAALKSAARALGVPDTIGTGTGGQAAHRFLSTPALSLFAAAVLLLLGAAVLMRRRPRVG